MEPMKLRPAPPKAGAMVEALRGLGYSTASALADIIDNSIAANATKVMLNFVWAGVASRVEIRDNGRGMSPDELDRAMRLGELNPLDNRSSHDLGRFGMGLKTASFSQCRSLTVTSWQKGIESCLRWDLDVLTSASDGGWFLLEGGHPDSEAFITPMGGENIGTLVLWEKLDRIVVDGFTEQDFLDLVDRVEQHLSMVFHRFINGDAARVSLLVNGRKIKPWDPFLTGHPGKAWTSPEIPFPPSMGKIKAVCHVLPHRDRLSEQEFSSLAGPDGWTSQQGFYVYRNKRLLVAGSWLGIGKGKAWTKDEAHQMARISVDIPNSVDVDWEIDIRKSSARPPVEMKKWLLRLAEDTQVRARKAFRARSRPVIKHTCPKDEMPVWITEYIGDTSRYRINRDHPMVQRVLQYSRSQESELYALFDLLEKTMPVQRIWASMDSTRVIHDSVLVEPEEELPSEEIQSALRLMCKNLVDQKGYSRESALRMLLTMEPFEKYPDFISLTLENL